ncbi:RDD family protein [Streptomyces sp. NBC_00847]|uniref:RDD family protein n=1 Tax=unclassified Streptomyces TaxID=2593676 RepID=UPI0022564586|nr:RDD family protein [Streptomyces sp. NBC_00847]MCX4882809.1 RDD family protein [Streptomyces sp. NBC_00847]
MDSKDLFGVPREQRLNRNASSVPASAAMRRRYGAATIDGTLAVVCACISGLQYVLSFPASEAPVLADGTLCLRILVAGIGFSLVNQVLLGLLFRCSVGKLLVGTRVVRLADGGRPQLWQLLVRWIGGIAYGLTILPLGFILGGSDAPPLDFAGVHIVEAAGMRSGHA